MESDLYFCVDENPQFRILVTQNSDSEITVARDLRHEMSSPLKHWERGSESHSRYGCLRFSVFLLSCECSALRWAYPSSKESYQRCIKVKS
jgi:hypothetical protein